MSDKNIQIILGFKSKGASQARRETDNVSKGLEDLAKKLRNADFAPMNELERSLRRAEFAGKGVAGEIGKISSAASGMSGLFGRNISSSLDTTSAAAGNLGNSLGLTKMQALTLTYTMNDVIASLASGGSIMTIVAQQGGQVTQAFGGVRGTFATLAPLVLRYAAALTGLGIAAAGALVVFKSLAATQAALDMRKAADEAGLTADQYQRLTQASEKLGLDTKGVLAALQSFSSKSKPTNDAIKKMGDQMTDAGEKARRGFIHFENGKFTNDAFGRSAKTAATDFKTLSDASRDNVKGMADYARQLVGVKDPLVQIRLAQEKFGSGASTMLDLIRKGTPAIDAWQKSMENVNPKFSEADIKIAEQTNRNLAEASAAWNDFAQNVERALLPIGLAYSKIKLQVINGISEIFSALGNIDVSGSISTIWQSIKADVENVSAFVRQKFSDVFSAISNFNVGGGLSTIWQSIKTDVVDVWSFVTQTFTDGFAALASIDVGASLASAWDSIKSGAESAWQSVAQTFRDGVASLASIDFGSLLSAMWDGVKSAAEQAYNYVAGVFERIKAVVSGAAASLASLVTGGSGGGEPQARASGGMIRGPGTATSDSILARLSNGEYVIKAAAVRHFGPSVFHALNNLKTPKFALGGLVGGINFRMPSINLPSFADGGLATAAMAAAPGGSGRSFSLVIDGQSYGGLTGSADTLDALERHATRRQLSATTNRSPGWRR